MSQEKPSPVSDYLEINKRGAGKVGKGEELLQIKQFSENQGVKEKYFKDKTTAEKRKYVVKNVKEAKRIGMIWLKDKQLENAVVFGLPEIDDRYHIWRIPLLSKVDRTITGEIIIDARTSLILKDKTTNIQKIEARLLGRTKKVTGLRKQGVRQNNRTYTISKLRNTIALGDSEFLLEEIPAQSVDLVFTSPPYYNAKPEYSDYITYEEYLLKIRKVIQKCHRVLSEGRFFVINVSPVLIRRPSRNKSSKRIAVPFDVHKLFVEEGFDFIDDIIWMKPEGAGWALGRGRRFAADRNPLQYKPVPVTEYVLVYRKHTDKLIDWNIRSHPDQNLVKESRIHDGYETTNVWKIKPAHDKRHPAVFPMELVQKVVSYYSFKNDVVLDPFAGTGTTAVAAIKKGRRFVMIETNPDYVNCIKDSVKEYLHSEAKNVLTLHTSPIDTFDQFI